MQLNSGAELVVSEFSVVVKPYFDFVSQKFGQETGAHLQPIECESAFLLINVVLGVKDIFENKLGPRVFLSIIFLLLKLFKLAVCQEELKDIP